jgi:hypothetical protein
MAWTTPPTFVSGNALTAAQLNILTADLNETAVAKAASAGQYFVATAANTLVARSAPSFNLYSGGGTDTTNSTSYTALTGGAAVTVTTGATCVIFHGASLGNDTAGSKSWATFAISGASTVSPTDQRAIAVDCSGANRVTKCGAAYTQTGITPGSNTFTQNFRVSSGIGAFVIRDIGVMSF